MTIDKEKLAELLNSDRFPRSAKYDPQWVVENLMGPHPLWLAEWLCESMELKPGMRVLDLGCGRAMTSIFLAKEFGVEVWANDLWISASDNWERVCEAGLEDKVFPIHAEAHELPYAHGFFDAVFSIDAYQYFGTDALYLGYIQEFLKPGGQLGIVCPGLTQEVDETVPEHLLKMFRPGELHHFWSFRTAAWWQKLWARTDLVADVQADMLEDGWRIWAETFHAALSAETGVMLEHLGAESLSTERDVIQADEGRYMGLLRVVAHRKQTATHSAC